MTTPASLRAPVLCAFVLVAVVAGPAAGATATGPGSVITVGDSEDAEFASIQAAVDAANPGDTVRVEPGVYREQVTVDVAVRLVAPRGATLNGSTLGEYAKGVKIRTDGDARVEGFTITGYSVGIDGDGNEVGDWVVRNTTVRNTSWAGVSGGGTTSDWRVRNVTVRDSKHGIYARSTHGAWRVTDTTIRNVSDGVDALAAEGGWVLDNVTVRDVATVGVSASHNAGDWRIRNATIRGATVGVGAISASGNWTVSGSTITDIAVSEEYDFLQPQLTEGVGIDASRTNGSWAVHDTRFAGIEKAAIVAEGANPAGNATGNRWDETASQYCVGNVSCGRTAATEQSPTPTATNTATATVTAATTDTVTTDTPTSDSPTSTTQVTSAQSTASSSQADDTQPTQSDPRSRVPGWSPRLGTVVGLVVAVLLISRRRQ